MNRFLYGFVWVLGNSVLRVIYPVKVTGKQNIPQEGGAMLCANHTSAIDPFVLAACAKRPVYFMAKKELFKNKLLGRVMTGIGAFPVDRGASDLGAIRKSLSLLKEGQLFGIFPQGTRARNGVEPEWLNGSSMIALRADVPVVPVAITPAMKPFRLTRIVIGEPMRFAGDERKFDTASLERATKRIRDKVHELAGTDTPALGVRKAPAREMKNEK